MIRIRLAILALAVTSSSVGTVAVAQDRPRTDVPSDAPPDALIVALEAMAIDASDLGYRPRAHWPRYPHPDMTPHVLPFFPDLHAHPLDTYGFTRGLGDAVERYLNPETLRAAPTPDDRRETLSKLAVIIGTDRLIGGFRGYSANLAPEPWEREPLLHACVTLLERSGRPLRRATSFGAKYNAAEPTPRQQLRTEVDTVPARLHEPLARFLLNLIEAREWIDAGLRDVPLAMREELFAALPGMTWRVPDGIGYDAVFDDVAKRVDAASLYYGCLKALQATQDARRELAAVTGSGGDRAAFTFELATPWGDVRFDATPAPRAAAEPAFVEVTFDAPPPAAAPRGATGPRRALSVSLHLGAAPGSTPDDAPKPGIAAVASGVLGCGIVYTAGEADNTYSAERWGLGVGAFGIGALIDEGGTDTYHLAAAGMGAGVFGIGLLLEAGGDDTYRLGEGDGQGYGGPAGVGVLADHSGNDVYVVERDAAKAGRADYHSENRIAVSNAQGAGIGRRGDGSDGHTWAGGLGALIDVDGNDTYRAGNFSQGIGYWYGTGLLWDGGGDDLFESVYFTQGSGAHFAIGALIDESGDDRHLLVDTAGAAFGFGWDVVNAFLIDRGHGDDVYEARIISTGLAEVRSNAFFIDEGGADTYVLSTGQQGFGDVDVRASYTDRAAGAGSVYFLSQVGVFLDLGGEDRYLRANAHGEREPDPNAGDGRTWNVRSRDPSVRGAPNVSYGADLEGGTVGFLAAWPARSPK